MTQTTSPAPTPGNAFWQRFRDLGSLRRSSDHRAVAGVAEGLSRHFDIDPIIVRVLFGALTFFGGAGLILYVALWVTVPTDVTGQSLISSRLRRDPHAWTTIGLATGGIFAAAALLGTIGWAVPHPFPFLLIVLVVVLGLLALTRKGDRGLGPSTTPEVADDETPREMTVVDPYPTTVSGQDSRAWWQRDDLPPTGNPIPPLAAQPPAPRKPRSHLFGLTMASIALAEAVVWIVDAASSTEVNPSVYPGTALVVIALGLLVGTWWGRARGLIAMGVLAVLLTAGAAFAGPGPYGDRHETPDQAGALLSSYRMGIGRFTLDLENVTDIAALQGRSVTIDQRFGQLRVVVPSSVAVIVDATVDHGSIDGPREVQSLDQGGEHVVLEPDSAGRPTVTLTLHVVYGDIRIERAVCPGDQPAVAGETTFIWNRGSSYVPAACN